MRIGMVGLGRMGNNMVQRLLHHGHQCAVYDVQAAAVESLAGLGARPCKSLPELTETLNTPRAIWLMLPADVVDSVLSTLIPLLQPGDTVIDGGNTAYQDDVRRAAQLHDMGIHYVDVGTSGGIAGRERGYCLMVGGQADAVRHLDPIFRALAPGVSAASPTPGRRRQTTADHGYLHCGPHGAGHFAKMVHNGIEYGMMAAYAEGMNLLHRANTEQYQYDFDIAEIAELWRRGSVVGSWLLDLTAQALQADPSLALYKGNVADSGEGRWALAAAIEQGVPAPVLAAALFSRFNSRGNADYANRLLSAMRGQFGGHVEGRTEETP
ncbi:MAG TPA: decarboxylating 6-phosphogluconate dehydrogenase [Candidimonas sp.]|nr:decarboxylating 6-phosphogluconate dehydrogenase [Candidimonas sp.]